MSTTSLASNSAAFKNTATEPEGQLPEGTNNQAPQYQELVEDSRPTHSADSEVDVTAYAESVVQRMEQMQTTTPRDEATLNTVPVLNETLNPHSTTLAELAAVDRRS